jgi:hypothetical protein
MSYVPPEVEYVSYVNYQEALAITHNSTLFGSSVLLELPQVNFAIFPSDIVYEVVIQPPEPQFSGSTTILQLTQDRVSALVNDMSLVNLTKARAPFAYNGYIVQELLMRKFGEQEYNLGFLSVVNQHIILSNDANTGLQDVEFVLDQIRANAANLFDDITVRRAVYATGVTDQSYAGLFVGMFSTQLNDTKMAVKSIVGNGNSILVSRALLFPTPDIALERLDQAHQIYRGTASFRILDSWLVVEYTYPLTRLQAELTGI